MLKKEVPQALYAHIGGSGTWGCDFPESLVFPGVKVIESDMEFDTPFGRTLPIKLLELNEDITENREKKYILDVVFHGWNGLSPYDEMPEERIFWVFQKAGVKRILADGTVASINPLLEIGDVLIPEDFIDYTKRPYNIGKFTDDIIRMTDIVCPEMKGILQKNAKKQFSRVFSRGTYGVYECPRLESGAEVRKFYNDHCDVLGHTMMPEAALARAINACYAPLYFVSDYAEGFAPVATDEIEEWENCAVKMGNVLLQTFADLNMPGECSCTEKKIILSEEVKNRIEPRRKRNEKNN